MSSLQRAGYHWDSMAKTAVTDSFNVQRQYVIHVTIIIFYRNIVVVCVYCLLYVHLYKLNRQTYLWSCVCCGCATSWRRCPWRWVAPLRDVMARSTAASFALPRWRWSSPCLGRSSLSGSCQSWAAPGCVALHHSPSCSWTWWTRGSYRCQSWRVSCHGRSQRRCAGQIPDRGSRPGHSWLTSRSSRYCHGTCQVTTDLRRRPVGNWC